MDTLTTPTTLLAVMPDADLYHLVFDGGLVALAVVALLTAVKQAIRAWKGAAALDRGGLQALLKLAPVVLGAALAVLVPGLFESYHVGARALLGAVSGFASPTVYGLLKQRLAGVLVSGAHADRAGKGNTGADGGDDA